MYRNEESEVQKSTAAASLNFRSEEHTSELQSQSNLVCRLLLEKKKQEQYTGRNFIRSKKAGGATPLALPLSCAPASSPVRLPRRSAPLAPRHSAADLRRGPPAP